MTTILPAARSSADVIGNMIGDIMAQNLPQQMQRGYERQLGLNALDQAEKDIASSNNDPFKIALAFAKAGAQNENLSRALGPLYESAMSRAQAMRAQNAPLAGDLSTRSQQNPSLPQFLNRPAMEGQKTPGQSTQFFPTNIGPQEDIGRIPQQAAPRVKEPLLSPSEIPIAARELARQRTAAGIPTTPKEALQEVKEAEVNKKFLNDEIDQELEAQKKSQRDYGTKASETLKKYYSNATPEMEAIFKKKGEEIASRGTSEAEIERAIAKEAETFSNAIKNVENDLSAPRLLETIGRKLNGTYKDLEKSGEDIKKHLKPVLDLGLFDTARRLLANKGFGPEEREAILHPLSENSKAIINQLPSVKKPPLTYASTRFAKKEKEIPVNINDVEEALQSMKTADPNFSLALARKGFEDKGYDWRVFKDALNNLEEKGFQLTDDQKAQRGILDTPPVSRLEQILHGLNLIGR